LDGYKKADHYGQRGEQRGEKRGEDSVLILTLA